MEPLIDDIRKIVHSYLCDCEIMYISHMQQLKCCHLNKQQLTSIEINPLVVFRHCCEFNDPHFMVNISDDMIENCFAEGIRICFQKPFKQEMMEWIMTRLSILPNTTLLNLELEDIVLPSEIGDQAGYTWLAQRGFVPCEEWKVAFLADDVNWCRSLSVVSTVAEFLYFGIRHTSVKCLLLYADHLLTSSVIQSMFATCIDFNRLDPVKDRIQFDVWYLFQEPSTLSMSYVVWVRKHFPNENFDARPAINALWETQFLLALQMVKEFQLEILDFTFTIDTDHLQEFQELFPHYFTRDVETYYDDDPTILHFGLAHGGYLTQPIMDQGDMDESSLPDSVVISHIKSYLQLDIHFDWCIKHLLRLYPKPNIIFNDLMQGLMDDPERLSAIYPYLDWGSMDLSAVIPLISVDNIDIFHDRISQLLKYAMSHFIGFGILLHYVLEHKIPFELTPLEIFVARMDAKHEQMIRLCFPHIDIGSPEPTHSDAWFYNTLATKRQKQ